MNISIVNQQGHNYGDEAAGCALVYELAQNEKVERINIFYASDSKIPIEGEKITHYSDISLRNIGAVNIFKYLISKTNCNLKITNSFLKEMCNVLSSSDVVFVSPCGASIGIYRDWRYLIRLLIVIKCGKTPIFHYNTIGKSNNLLFDFIARKILKKSVLFVREEKSQKFLHELGLNAILGPDTAFLLNKLQPQSNIKEVAFVPAHLDDWHPYFRKNRIDNFVETRIIAEISKWLDRNNMSIKIVPHFNLDSEKAYCRYIADQFCKFCKDSESVRVAENVNSYLDYDQELANSYLVIGMRYHSIVLAAKNEVPYLAFSYENKMNEVANYTNQTEYCIDLDNNDLNAIAGSIQIKLDHLLENRNKIIKSLSETNDGLKNKARYIINHYC